MASALEAARDVTRGVVERYDTTQFDGGLHPLHFEDVTASVVGATVTHHPYMTIGQLFYRVKGLVLPKDNEAALRRGRYLERVVAEVFQDENPDWDLCKANVYLRDPDLRLGAHPDYRVRDPQGRPGILEAKTVGAVEF